MGNTSRLPTLVLLSAFATWSALSAQAPAESGTAVKPGAIQACSLLSNSDVESVTGRRMVDAPHPTSLAGGAGSACTFHAAQLILFSGEKSEEHWEAFLRNFGLGNETRHPVPGLGDRAYAFYPKPQNASQDPNALVVVTVGQHTVAVSVAAEQGKPAESAQPQAVELATMVAAKLR